MQNEALIISNIICIILLIILTSLVIFFLVKNKKILSKKTKVENDELNHFKVELVKLFSELETKLRTALIDEYASKNNKILNEINEKFNKASFEINEKINIFLNENRTFNKDFINNINSFLITNQDSIKNILLQNINENIRQINNSLNSQIISGPDSLTSRLNNILNSNLNSFHNQYKQDISSIRNEINEQLKSSLVKKIEEEFQNTSNTIKELNHSVSTIGDVNNNVKQIINIFQNNKKFGRMGERLLEEIIRSALGENMEGILYEFQNSDGELKIPDAKIYVIDPYSMNANSKIYIPVDSKFSASLYSDFLNDKINEEETIKEFISRLKSDFKKVASYLKEGLTTEKAIMFIPSDSIFYFIMSNQKLREIVENNINKVILTSPSNIIWYLDLVKRNDWSIKIAKSMDQIKHTLEIVRDNYKIIIKALEDASSSQQKALKSTDKAKLSLDRPLKELNKTFKIMNLKENNEFISLSDEFINNNEQIAESVDEINEK
ncbi:DNA recombination protein RmuC [Mycoplasmopsis meleagridis]|uniref:DNA recombination protein RmuC n=1 Tax=Mycoplasmopsis meleagridis TaxID=29561 RepID=UPI00073D94F0|nr:DNA recombination protein RmuC [Mycoplasmopsis meleagridis]KUH47564.1 hypothetical protein ASB56_00295 [Mycoplasmopsis meleagridis]